MARRSNSTQVVLSRQVCVWAVSFLLFVHLAVLPLPLPFPSLLLSSLCACRAHTLRHPRKQVEEDRLAGHDSAPSLDRLSLVKLPAVARVCASVGGGAVEEANNGGTAVFSFAE